MKKQILKPIYARTITKPITLARLEDANILQSKVAGFHWTNNPFPFPHTHEHWELLMVVNGAITHKINGVCHKATKGYACIIRPEDVHCFSFPTTKSEVITFGFCKEIAQKFFDLYPIEKELLESTVPLSFTLRENTIDAVCSKSLAAQFCPKNIYEKYTTLIINRLFLAYYEQKLNTVEAYPDWLNSFLLLLKSPKYLRKPVSELVKLVPYSYSQLSKLFKQYTGKTLVSYLNELKLIRAKELLRNTAYTVMDIAVELNYESVSSLNHNFKRFTGLTPSEFRKSSSVF